MASASRIVGSVLVGIGALITAGGVGFLLWVVSIVLSSPASEWIAYGGYGGAIVYWRVPLTVTVGFGVIVLAAGVWLRKRSRTNTSTAQNR